MEHLFLSILNMSMTASYVILFVLLVRPLLRKSPKLFSYILWSVVLFRLTCPVSFSSVISFLKPVAPSTGKLEYIPHDIGLVQQPMVDTGIGSASNAINSSLPPAVNGASANPMQIILFVLAIVWIAVMLVLISYSIITYLQMKKRVGKAVRVRDNIYTVENIPTAFVLGLLKPRIYLPVGLSELEQSYILRHEQTHIKRLDYIIKPIAFLVLCVHWFNPLVWLSFILMSRDMEMSCDERVIAQLGSGIKKDYSTSLLSLSTGRRLISASPLAFGEGNVKSRIKNVLNYRRPAFWVIILTAILLAIAGIGLCANPDGHSETVQLSPKNLIDSIGNTDKVWVKEFSGETYSGRTYLSKEHAVNWINSVEWNEKKAKPSIDTSSKTYSIIISDKPRKEIRFYFDTHIAGVVYGDSETYYSIAEKEQGDMLVQILSRSYFEPAEKQANEQTVKKALIDRLKEYTDDFHNNINTEQQRESSALSQDKIDKIEQNLEIIMSSPRESSNPGDYIKAHKKEYDEIVAMGDEVLPYLEAIWDKGDHGLKGVLANNICRDIKSELNVVSSDSPNGKLRLETYGVNTDITAGGLYPAEGIRLIQKATGKVLWQQTPGYYKTDFLWSPDNKYAAITNQARTYGETVILDTEKLKTISIPGIVDLIKNNPKLNLTAKGDRADPYFTAKEWFNNSIVEIKFTWMGENDILYVGSYLYDVVNHNIVSIGVTNKVAG